MEIYLSKILPMLVLPPGIVMLLILLALYFVLRDKRKKAIGSLTIALIVLWSASMPLVANRLALVIESHYPATSLDRIPVSGCIVLMGGFVSAPVSPRQDMELNDSVDRVFKTAELYFAGKAPVVIVTGGRQSWSKSNMTEAAMMRDLLMMWQVPDGSILVEDRSRNTRENALFSKEIINTIDCEQPLLVTSAAHMPRSVATFASIGINVFPVSTDIRAAEDSNITPMDFLPDAGALSMTSTVLREWMGQMVYQWRGWN